MARAMEPTNPNPKYYPEYSRMTALLLAAVDGVADLEEWERTAARELVKILLPPHLDCTQHGHGVFVVKYHQHRIAHAEATRGYHFDKSD